MYISSSFFRFLSSPITCFRIDFALADFAYGVAIDLGIGAATTEIVVERLLGYQQFGGCVLVVERSRRTIEFVFVGCKYVKLYYVSVCHKDS